MSERDVPPITDEYLDIQRRHSQAIWIWGLIARLDAAEAEVARLRAALEEIATGGLVERGCVQVATAALALKPKEPSE